MTKKYFVANDNRQTFLELLKDVPEIVTEHNKTGELPDVTFSSQDAGFGKEIHDLILHYRMYLMRELMKQESPDMPDILGSINIRVDAICGSKDFHFISQKEMKTKEFTINNYMNYENYLKWVSRKEPLNLSPYIWLGSILKEHVESVVRCFEAQFKSDLSAFKYDTDKLLYMTNHLSAIDKTEADEFVHSISRYIVPPKTQYVDTDTLYEHIFEETLAKLLGDKIYCEYHYVFGGLTQAMADSYRTACTLDELFYGQSSLSKIDQLYRYGYCTPCWVDRKDRYSQAISPNLSALNIIIDHFKDWLPLLGEIENQRLGYDLIEFATEQLTGYSKDCPDELSQAECSMLIDLVTALKKCVLTPNEIQRIWKLDGFNRENEKVKKFRLWFFQY